MVTTTSLSQKSKKLQLADKAHALNNEIKSTRNLIEGSFLQLAKLLKQVRDEKLYKYLNYDTFESYIANPDLCFDRSSVYKFIQIYETFVEGYNVDSNRLLNAGWVKLAKIVPHIKKDNYEYYLEKAENLSLSDLNEVMVEHGFITKKEPEQAKFVEVDCPKCKNHFVWNILNRSDKSFPKDDYKQVIDKYIEVKEIAPKGDEYKPIQQAVKSMFLNGRTPKEIIATIEQMEEAEYEWTMNTIKNKIAEILPKITKDIEPITDFERRWRSK